LKQFETAKGYLMDTCYSAQDEYKKLVDYFMEE
ncbi:MAG TPA: cell filamentation protein Fic, partial [Trichococcus sp.]|nr:cell filamentation protein Fic [Trichococcus sp.]